MNTKTLSRVEIKNADRGEVEVAFATFDTVDKDGDVTLRGAFADAGDVLISAYGHASHRGALPVGKGTIRETSTEAIFGGRFFMDTQAGKDTFTVVKELGALQEWSYGYEALKHSFGEFAGRKVRFLEKLHVLEVSPVLEGAGINTRTLSAKNADRLREAGYDPEAVMAHLLGGNVTYKAAIRPHSTEIVNRPWDRNAVVSAVPDDVSVSDLRSMAAWVNPGADPETKEAYRFWHHHGPDGPANVRAAVAGIAVLNGARGVDVSSTPWAGDREGIYSHLANHLRDADREPPELRSADGGSIKADEAGGPFVRLHADIAGALVGVADAMGSTDRVVALRAAKKRGKSLSKTNAEYLDWLDEDLLALHRKLRSFVDSPDDEAAREYARFVRSQIGGRTL